MCEKANSLPFRPGLLQDVHYFGVVFFRCHCERCETVYVPDVHLGPGGDGCIILYYRKPKPVQSGALRTSDGRDLLDALDRRMIV